MLVTGEVTEVRSKGNPEMYFLEVQGNWISAFGKTTIKQGDKIEAEVLEVKKDNKTYFNIEKITVREESKQSTLVDDINEQINNNKAFMNRCYEDANEILKKYSDGGFVNPEALGKTAIALFLALKGKK